MNFQIQQTDNIVPHKNPCEKTIYIKLTNDCQLRCKHCYNDIMHNKLYMSDEVLAKVIKYITKIATDSPNMKITCILHGGEPMLYEPSKIIHLMDSCSVENINWAITSNLCYTLTPKHIEIFKRLEKFDNKPLLSTSWDYKIRFATHLEELLWKANVKQILENGIDIQPIICLTNALITDLTPKVVFETMTNLNIHRFNFERITSTGLAKQNNLRPTNYNVNKWLGNAFKLYKSCNDIHIPIFETAIEATHGNLLGCRARQCMKNIITINPDGTIAGCPNTADNSFGTLDKIDDVEYKKMACKEQVRDIRCLVCEYFKFCNGDCFQLGWDKTGCPGLKSVFKQFAASNIKN